MSAVTPRSHSSRTDPVPGGRREPDGVHPLIRVLCFLVFAACVAPGGGAQLLLGGAVLAAAYAWPWRGYAGYGLTMVLRIRWLLIAIVGIYGWSIPGQPVLAANGWSAAALPTQEGLGAGAVRALALIMIVLAVNALLRSTSREQLMSAIYRLCSPLRLIGLSPERLAVRMVLTMDTVDHARGLVSRSLADAGGVLRTLPSVGRFASGLVREVDRRAAGEPCTVVTLVVGAQAPAWQWLYPVLLWALLSGSGLLI